MFNRTCSPCLLWQDADDDIGVDSDEFDEEQEEDEQVVKKTQKLKTPLRHTTGSRHVLYPLVKSEILK